MTPRPSRLPASGATVSILFLSTLCHGFVLPTPAATASVSQFDTGYEPSAERISLPAKRDIEDNEKHAGNVYKHPKNVWRLSDRPVDPLPGNFDEVYRRQFEPAEPLVVAVPFAPLVTSPPQIDHAQLHKRDFVRAQLKTADYLTTTGLEREYNILPKSEIGFVKEFEGFFGGVKQLSDQFTAASKLRPAMKSGLPFPVLSTPSPTVVIDKRATKTATSNKKANKKTPDEQYKTVLKAYGDLKDRIAEKEKSQQAAKDRAAAIEAAELAAAADDSPNEEQNTPGLNKRQHSSDNSLPIYYSPPYAGMSVHYIPVPAPYIEYPYPQGDASLVEDHPERSQVEAVLEPSPTIDPAALEKFREFQGMIRGFGVELGLKEPAPIQVSIPELVESVPVEYEPSSVELLQSETIDEPTPTPTELNIGDFGDRLMNYEGNIGEAAALSESAKVLPPTSEVKKRQYANLVRISKYFYLSPKLTRATRAPQ